MNCFKRSISLILVVLMVVSVFAVSMFSTAAVTTVKHDDFTYVINGNSTYYIYKYNGTETDVVLPETLNGNPVLGVYDNCFLNNSTITSVTMPDSYTYIGNSAFYGCSALKSVTLPSSLTTFGTSTFAYCTSLESIDLAPATQITTLPYGCLQGCTSLKSVTIPANINKIDGNAFYGSGLTSLDIPDTVTSLGTYFCSGCTDLASVKLPSKITALPNYSFNKCSSLTSIVIPDSVTSIGNRAFYECSKLSDVQLPLSLKTIGTKVFYNNNSLQSIYIPDSVTSIGADSFYPMGVQKTLVVDCVEDSYVDTYCYENYIPTSLLIKGDFTLDKEIDVRDVTGIQKYLVGNVNPAPKAVGLIELTGDGKIDVRDVTKLQKFIAKAIDSLD